MIAGAGLIPEVWWPPSAPPSLPPWSDPSWGDERNYELPKIAPRYDPEYQLATAFVQAKSNQATSATSVVVTMDAALTVGNFVVVGVSNGTASDFKHPNDDASGGTNVYRAMGGKLAVRVPNLQMFYCVPNHASGAVITCDVTVSGTVDAVVMEFSGAFTSSVSSFVRVNRADSPGLISSATAVTIPSTTVGNLIAVCITNADGKNVTSVADSSGNAYAKLKGATGAEIWGTIDTHGGATTVTPTMNGATSTVYVSVGEFSGAMRVAGSNQVTINHSGSDTNTGTAVALSTAMGTQVGNLTLACIYPGGNRGITEGSGYTRLTNTIATDQKSILAQYKLSSSATSETTPGTLDSSGTWVIAAVEVLPNNASLLSNKAGAGSAASGTTSLTANLVGATPTAGSLLVVFATAAAAEAWTAGSGFTLGVDGTNAGGEYKLIAPGSAETFPFTMDTLAAWQLEAFEVLVTAAASTAARKTLLGVGA